jgi:unsaturated rhamnogalacturonyl hydrolase
MPALAHSISRVDVQRYIELLMRNLVDIKDHSGEFLLKLADGRIIDTKGWNDWEWTHGIGLYGIWKFYEGSGDPRALEIITSWFRDRFAAGTPTKNVNTMSPILTLAHLYELTGDRTYLPYLDAWSEWVMHEMPRTEEGGLQHIVFNNDNPQQLWDDTLMMCVLPLAKVGRLLGRLDYLAEAQRQFLLHVKYLHDPKTGLWFHGWTFEGRHHFAQALWARGNCWVTIAIPEFIELMELPEGDPVRTFLIDTLHAQVRMLAKCQDSSGLWNTLITDPTSYLESSATAGFAYGIMKAVRKRYLPREYEPAAIKALRAVIDNIDATGELRNVSFGTAMGRDLEYYRNVPLTSMPYGQSLAILCLTEFLRRYI